MINKDLRKLSRKQLLELLLKQTERADQLEQLLSETEKKLEDKVIIKKEAGSIAEAALVLNGVFEAAEAAAAQYLENIKLLNEGAAAPFQKAEEESKKIAEEMIREAEKKCALREAKADKVLKETYIKLRLLKKEIDELEMLKKQY